jgi:DNA-directed RNA polymerase subunit RPC12/RpoP
MAIKDTDRKARANYKKKITTIRVELYGTDDDIREHLEKLKEAGGSVQGYIKGLIRDDIPEIEAEWVFDDADEYGASYKCTHCGTLFFLRDRNAPKPDTCPKCNVKVKA